MIKPKNRSATQIIRELQILLKELESYLLVETQGGKHLPTKKPHYSGASGGVRLLFEEGYFNEARSFPEVTAQLRQEGFNYSRNTISMALLRAVRSRLLVRLHAEGREGRKKWVYIIRK